MPLLGQDEVQSAFLRVLLACGIARERAEACAGIFLANTLAGVQSHGVNRFPRFIGQLRSGHIDPAAEPEPIQSLGALERWNGRRGIGPLNARQMMNRAVVLARQNGIGLVALANTNHWMRGGTYGYQAAEQGFIGICWTNTIGLMPPWGGRSARIGNNPLVVAVPGEPITLVDLAMSMFSYGALESHRLAGRPLPADGGYDAEGNLSRDPGAIEQTRRILPMGLWKGSGLAIVLDMMAALLSGGLSTVEITEDQNDEFGVSQVFIAIDVERLSEGTTRAEKLARIRDYILSSEPAEAGRPLHLPGHDLAGRIEAQQRKGIVVDDGVWAKINAL